MRIDHLIFGYFDVKIEAEYVGLFADRALSAGISLTILPDGRVRVPLLRRRAVRSLLDGIPHEVGRLCGLPAILSAVRRRPGICLGVLLAFAISLYAGGAVWDIRVMGDGREHLSDAAVLAEAEAAGLSVGARFRDLDLSAVETAMLDASEEIGWVSIDRRGMVAYITVGEKHTGMAPAQDTRYANVVAAYDCVIEEITVNCGVAAVRVGDVVRAGDLLISGVLPDEIGGGFCRAEGTVRGRLTETATVVVPRRETVRTYEAARLEHMRLNFLDFSINIFKRYGNSAQECAIIEENRRPVLFSDYPLPLSVNRTIGIPYHLTERYYPDDELTALAAARLRAAIVSRLAGADLHAISTEGTFTDDGYRMTSVMTVVREVGRIDPIVR